GPRRAASHLPLTGPPRQRRAPGTLQVRGQVRDPGWSSTGRPWACVTIFYYRRRVGAPARAVGGSWRTRADLEVCPTSFGYRVGRTARVYVGLRRAGSWGCDVIATTLHVTIILFFISGLLPANCHRPCESRTKSVNGSKLCLVIICQRES